MEQAGLQGQGSWAARVGAGKRPLQLGHVLGAAPCLSYSLVSQKSSHDMLRIGSVANKNAVMTRHRAVDQSTILMTEKSLFNSPSLSLFSFTLCCYCDIN